MKTILFVYGTLKRGERNHHLLAGQEYLGEAVTAPKYRMRDLGAHPALECDFTNGSIIQGELFSVSDECLEKLDEFEDVPNSFTRDPVEVKHSGIVWAYFLNMPIPPDTPCCDRWPRSLETGG